MLVVVERVLKDIGQETMLMVNWGHCSDQRPSADASNRQSYLSIDGVSIVDGTESAKIQDRVGAGMHDAGKHSVTQVPGSFYDRYVQGMEADEYQHLHQKFPELKQPLYQLAAELRRYYTQTKLGVSLAIVPSDYDLKLRDTFWYFGPD